MGWLKKLLKSKKSGSNNTEVIIVSDDRRVKVNADINKILAPKRQEEKELIRATNAFQLLMQATADSYDARELYINSQIISESMSASQSIAYLFALYVFLGFEAEFSPALAASLLKTYCIDEIHKNFIYYYTIIAQSKSINVSSKTFDKPLDVVLDISGFAKEARKKNAKRHWNPFKFPYDQQWDQAFN